MTPKQLLHSIRQKWLLKTSEIDSQAAAPQHKTEVIIKDSEIDSQAAAPQHKTEVIIKDSEIDSQAAAPQHKTEVIIKDFWDWLPSSCSTA